MRKLIVFILFSAVFTSCVDTKKLSQESIYFQQVTDSVLKNSRLEFQSVIQKGDLLYIAVNTTNEASARILNQQNFYSGIITANGPSNSPTSGYLVDEKGRISFPYIGKIRVEGMSRITIADSIEQALKPYVNDAIVAVRIMNYKVTVLGEVARPGTISIPNERVTVLDALGLAGDLTPFGRRDNIKVIREVNGRREMGVLNIKGGKIFDSPFFYLQQNDVVYVEMTERKMANVDQASVRNLSIGLAAVSTIAILVTTISNL